MGAERTPRLIRKLRGVRWWLGPTADPELVSPLLAAAIGAVDSGAENLKSGRRKELYRLALRGVQPDHLLKVTRYRSGSPWTRRVRRSKARRELDVASQLHDRGIGTPLPVAAGESRRAGLLTACYLLVPFEPDTIDLAAFANSPADPRERRVVARQFGTVARRLHDIGFRQHDFAPNNFLLRTGDPPEILPIDFERATLVSGSTQLGRQERLQALAKLERHCIDVTLTDRLRFLIAYTGNREETRREWRELELAIATLFSNDRIRLLPTAASGARRYQSFQAGDWHGWAVQHCPRLDRIETWLDCDSVRERVDVQPAFWVCSYGEDCALSAAELWASSQALWVRGLGPKPICALQRGREVRLFLDRNDPHSTGIAHEARSVRPVLTNSSLMRLIERLLGLGELSSTIATVSLGVLSRQNGSSDVVLIDAALLLPGNPKLSDRRARAQRISERLLATDHSPAAASMPG